MADNFKQLLQNKKIFQGEKLESEALIVAQKVLCGMGLDFLPASYADFLRQYNGIKFEGSYLFGATVDDDLDIIDKNRQMRKPQDCILLGYNEFDLLCYNYKMQQYQIVDRVDFMVLDCYDEAEFDEALCRFFKI